MPELKPDLAPALERQRYAQGITRAWGIAALSLLALALCAVFFIAPRGEVRAGGDAQRIFYFHLSAAWVGFGAWIVTAIYSVAYLRKRDLRFDRVAVASAEIGVVFLAMVLLTGMIWGKVAWNTWWTWDTKLTLSLLQFLLYVAYLVLRSGVEEPDKRARFAAVYGLLGVLTVPLNFLVSRVLNSVHPAVFGPSINAQQQGGSGIAGPMYPILLFSILAFTVAYIYFVRRRVALQQAMDQAECLRAELLHHAG